MTSRQFRLLLVEDSDDDVRLISRSLRRSGYATEIVQVESSQQLCDALPGKPFDLAITDHALRGFDSSDVLVILAELAPDVPCILVSGKVGEEAVGQAMRRGAVDYVAKDNLGLLPRAVERILAEKDREKESAEAEAAAARSAHMFEAVFANARDAMLIVDDDRRLVDVNPAATELVGMPRQDLLERRIDELMPAEWRVNASDAWAEFLSTGSRRGEVEIQRADGELVATEYTAAASFLPDRHIMVLRDIRERAAAEAEVKRRVAQQQAIAELGEMALRDKGVDALMAAAVTSVMATMKVTGASIVELRTDEDSFSVRAEAGAGSRRIGTQLPIRRELRSIEQFTVRQGEPVLVADYETETRLERSAELEALGVRSALSVAVPGTDGTFGVITARSTEAHGFSEDDVGFLTGVANVLADALARINGEEMVRRQALRDPLTGLANRTLFYDRLGQALARAPRQEGRVAVVFVDIDHFKALNDRLGHRGGDELLIEVGRRIQGVMRESDTVARLGGDEFIVLGDGLAGEAEAELLATRVMATFEEPFSVGEGEYQMNASIGVALSDADNRDGETLVRDADIALYRSKESGRGCWTLATEAMRVAVVERTETREALKHAIFADELILHYQPIVALNSGAICAVEALVRWQDPRRGMIPPDQFIPLAEESGLILELGEWVLRSALEQAATWRAEFGDTAPLPLHVNVSARQVADSNLIELVRATLTETGALPGDVALEITETALIDNVGVSKATLVELRNMGLSVVLDDFGTGYSSLSYVERFPIETLKVDRSFVSSLADPGSHASIITAIVGMARALSLATVAEGVETAEQTAMVAVLGCDRAQGYFFARPGPASQISDLARDDSPLRERALEAAAASPALPGDSSDDRGSGGRPGYGPRRPLSALASLGSNQPSVGT